MVLQTKIKYTFGISVFSALRFDIFCWKWQRFETMAQCNILSHEISFYGFQIWYGHLVKTCRSANFLNSQYVWLAVVLFWMLVENYENEVLLRTACSKNEWQFEAMSNTKHRLNLCSFQKKTSSFPIFTNVVSPSPQILQLSFYYISFRILWENRVAPVKHSVRLGVQ